MMQNYCVLKLGHVPLITHNPYILLVSNYIEGRRPSKAAFFFCNYYPRDMMGAGTCFLLDLDYQPSLFYHSIYIYNIHINNIYIYIYDYICRREGKRNSINMF